jgi:hypothetical protein
LYRRHRSNLRRLNSASDPGSRDPAAAVQRVVRRKKMLE